jgi:hypothetical protein
LEVTRRVRRACQGVGLKARDGKRPFFWKIALTDSRGVLIFPPSKIG